MQRSIAEVIGNVIFHSPSGNPSALTLCSNGTNTSPGDEPTREVCHEDHPDAAGRPAGDRRRHYQAQDGSERSWQYNAEFRAAQKELREKRLQKQQLEAQAQKTDRSKCAERKNGNG
ncbi:hypothetical protein P4113_18065 [Pseudomonas aeruginosa]|nr:hypothetical protein [Pseudomonas aeruginosa]